MSTKKSQIQNYKYKSNTVSKKYSVPKKFYEDKNIVVPGRLSNYNSSNTFEADLEKGHHYFYKYIYQDEADDSNNVYFDSNLKKYRNRSIGRNQAGDPLSQTYNYIGAKKNKNFTINRSTFVANRNIEITLNENEFTSPLNQIKRENCSNNLVGKDNNLNYDKSLKDPNKRADFIKQLKKEKEELLGKSSNSNAERGDNNLYEERRNIEQYRNKKKFENFNSNTYSAMDTNNQIKKNGNIENIKSNQINKNHNRQNIKQKSINKEDENVTSQNPNQQKFKINTQMRNEKQNVVKQNQISQYKEDLDNMKQNQMSQSQNQQKISKDLQIGNIKQKQISQNQNQNQKNMVKNTPLKNEQENQMSQSQKKQNKNNNTPIQNIDYSNQINQKQQKINLKAPMENSKANLENDQKKQMSHSKNQQNINKITPKKNAELNKISQSQNQQNINAKPFMKNERQNLRNIKQNQMSQSPQMQNIYQENKMDNVEPNQISRNQENFNAKIPPKNIKQEPISQYETKEEINQKRQIKNRQRKLENINQYPKLLTQQNTPPKLLDNNEFHEKRLSPQNDFHNHINKINMNNNKMKELNVSVVKRHEEKTLLLVPGQTIEPKNIIENFTNPVEEIIINHDGTTTSLIKQTKIITTTQNVPIDENIVKSIEGAPELPMIKQYITHEYQTITTLKENTKNKKGFAGRNNILNSDLRNKGYPGKYHQKGFNQYESEGYHDQIGQRGYNQYGNKGMYATQNRGNLGNNNYYNYGNEGGIYGNQNNRNKGHLGYNNYGNKGMHGAQNKGNIRNNNYEDEGGMYGNQYNRNKGDLGYNKYGKARGMNGPENKGNLRYGNERAMYGDPEKGNLDYNKNDKCVKEGLYEDQKNRNLKAYGNEENKKDGQCGDQNEKVHLENENDGKTDNNLQGNQKDEKGQEENNKDGINKNKQTDFSSDIFPKEIKNEEEAEALIDEINKKGENITPEEKQKRIKCIEGIFNKISKEGKNPEQYLEKLSKMLMNMNEKDRKEILSKLKKDFPNNADLYNKLLKMLQKQTPRKSPKKGKGKLDHNNSLGNSGRENEFLAKSGLYDNEHYGYKKEYSGLKERMSYGLRNNYSENIEVKEINPLKFDGLFLEITKYNNENREKNPFEGPSPYSKFYQERRLTIKRKINNMGAEGITLDNEEGNKEFKLEDENEKNKV